MSKFLRVLIVEDSEDDMLLLLRELRRGGYEPVFERVETAESMRAALAENHWDLVISDYVLPHFSGLSALEVLKASRIDIPFFLVSGQLGEDRAVEAMRAGAQDYIIKGNLARLVPAVERELRDAEVRRERSRLEGIKKEKEFIDAVLNTVDTLIFILDRDGRIVGFNRACEALSGYSFAEVKDRHCWDLLLLPEEAAGVRAVFKQLRAGDYPNRHENHWLTKSGERRFIEFSNTALTDGSGQVQYVIATGIDVTERRKAEEELRRHRDMLEDLVRERTMALETTVSTLHNEILDRIKAEEDLLHAQERLVNTLESIRDGFFALDREWRFTFVNREAMRLWQKSGEELIGKSIWEVAPQAKGTIFEEQYERALRERVPVVFEALSPLIGVWVEVRAYPSEDGIAVTFLDINERKEMERFVEVTNDLLKLFAVKHSRKEYLDAAVALLKEWCGCGHLGMRVANESGNIPYESCAGYSGEFLRSENTLSLHGDHCACTRVALGRPEPQDRPVMTQNGSFFCNDTALFLESLDPAERARFRNACTASGFLSVAVVPIRYRDKIIGAIHVADERRGIVPPKMVAALEQTAFIIGEALFRFGIEDELRRNYQALLESETRYRSLVDDVRDVVFTLTKEGNIGSLNPAFESILGWSREEWIGKHFSLLLHPEDIPLAQDLFRLLLAGKTLPVFVLRIPGRSGEYHFFEFTISTQRGNGELILGISRDITERIRAEQEHARLVAAVQSSADAVVITDRRGFIQYVNPAFEQVTGYRREEAIGRDLHILDSGKHDEAFFRSMRESMEHEGVWRGTIISKKKDETLYHEECTNSAIKTASGEIINYISVKRDVTEKLRLEAVAESVTMMDNIGYVFSGVRHEIGNPINSVNMVLGILKAKLDGLTKESIREYLNRIAEQVGRVEYILRSLKSFNMFETQVPQNVLMSAFLENFLPLVRGDFARRGIEIKASVDPEAKYAYVDPRALQQVVLNVMTNAADALAGRQDPRITLTVSRQDGKVRLQVVDNGCGISEDKKKYLFKPFFTTKAHGTGLGLVIVKKMLSHMNGTIEIESQGDEGTLVDITVPEGRE
jgi:PAS domain S-box-containing protein